MKRAVVLAGTAATAAAVLAGPAAAEHRHGPAPRGRRAVAPPVSVPAVAQPKPREVTVSGRILDLDGNPAASARVYLGWIDTNNQFQVGSFRTNAAGRFTAKARLSPHMPPSVGVSALLPGKGFAWKRYTANGAQLGCGDVRVTAGTTLRGRVVHPTGRSVSGVTVNVEALTPGFEFRPGMKQEDMQWLPNAKFLPEATVKQFFQAQSDDRGFFSIPALPRHGQVQLNVGAGLEITPGSQSPIHLQDVAETPAGVLVASKTGSITVHLTDAKTGKPAPNVEVQVLPGEAALAGAFFGRAPNLPDVAAGTDQDGNLLVPRLLPGEYTVTVQGGKHTVVVEEGKAAPTLELKARAEALSGVVLDPSGKPVANLPVLMEGSKDDARLMAAQIFGGGNTAQPVSNTGPKGEFFVPNFPWQSKSVTLRVLKGNAEAVWTGAPEQLGSKLVLRMKPNARVTVKGRLLDPNRKPVTAGAAQVIRWQEGPRISWFGSATQAQVDAQGRFQVSGLERGQAFSLIAGSPLGGGSGEPSYESPRFTTAEGEGAVQDLGEMVIHPLEGPEQILQVYGIESQEQLSRLSGLMKEPSAADVAAARAALGRYQAAMTEGNLDTLHEMTSRVSFGWSENRTHFLVNNTFQVTAPGKEIQPLRMVPLISAAYLNTFRRLLKDPSLGFNLGGSAREVEENPNWVFFITPKPDGIELAGVMHQEEGEWRVVNFPTSPGAEGILFTQGTGPTPGPNVEGFNQPAPALSNEAAAAARAAAEQYLAAWSGGQEATCFALTSPLAICAAKDLTGFKKALKHRLDEGHSPVPSGARPELRRIEGLTRWEMERLASYSLAVTEITGNRRLQSDLPETQAAAEGFPTEYVKRGGAAAFRYRAGDQSFIMILLEHKGKWQVLEPAVPTLE